MSASRIAVVALALAGLLVGCAETRVVREYPRENRRPHASRPAPPKRGSANATATTVRKGDTVYRIATEHGISPLDLAMWNRIPPPYTIYPGQRLRLRPPDSGSSASGRPALRPPVAGSRPPTNPVTSKPPVTPPQPPKPPVAPPEAGFAWRWPADGQIVGGYLPGNPTRQGIDIAGQGGAAVRAAADGEVVYSGTGLVGYGELIIVKHNEQWLTAYGHNRARLVNEGQRVKAGDQIAEMGRSGATRDMLHFEIRYNGKPQDPLLHLPKR